MRPDLTAHYEIRLSEAIAIIPKGIREPTLFKILSDVIADQELSRLEVKHFIREVAHIINQD